MFGETPGESVVKVCCGPRCGAEPGHRAIYAAVEAAAQGESVRPAMCQGWCGLGVTVVLPDQTPIKISDSREVPLVWKLRTGG